MPGVTFVVCELCGKRLIERLPDGLLRFHFGKDPVTDSSPVEMQIYGTVKMKCIRKSCNHWNVFNGFTEVV
jgi:hypothetical protein